MNEIKKKVLGMTSFLSKKGGSSAPFEVLLEKGTDVTKQKPYYIEVKIIYHDTLFKKRISNLLKEKKLLMEYRFHEVNKGTLFKPIKVWEAETLIKEALLSSTEAFMVEALAPSFLQGMTHLSNEQVVPLKKINGHIFSFANQDNRDVFRNSLLDTLNSFFTKEYEKYVKLTDEGNE